MDAPASTAIRCLGIDLARIVPMRTDLDQGRVIVIRPTEVVLDVVPIQATFKDQIAPTEVHRTESPMVLKFDPSSIGKIDQTVIHSSANDWKTFAVEDRSMTARFVIA